MNILSSAFEHAKYIPKKFTCDGWDINPEILIENVPAEAKSLAIILIDPDSPSGDFVHWLVWNISPKTTLIKEESVPAGSVEGENDFGKIGYGGPCPHVGEHHYHFKLFALDDVLSLPEGSKKDDLMQTVEGHILAEAELVGLYRRHLSGG